MSNHRHAQGASAPDGKAAPPPQIETHNLGMRYPNGTVALHDVNVTIRPGEFTVIVGPSGCGKSTLLHIIAGLIKSTSGDVLVSGRKNPSPGKDRALVFQQPGLLPWYDVLTNIELGLRSDNVPADEARRRSTELLDKIGLGGFGKNYPYELSGGMQQRVGVARAFAVDPPILLMDEPFAAVDAQTREVLQEEVIRLWEGTGKTVIFVTHSIEEAIFLADRVLVMQAKPGRIHEDVDISIPRPRGEATRWQDEYQDLHKQLWEMLRYEATGSDGGGIR